MSVIGVGLDLVEVARVERALGRFGGRFAGRIYTAAELALAGSGSGKMRFLASRFAAKEAVAKALGTGIGGACRWRDVEILRGENGKPRVLLHGAARGAAAGLGARIIHVSVTHTATHAAAVAVVEG